MSENKEFRMGSFGRDISDAVSDIVNQVMEHADSIVSVSCDIPDGFFKISDQSNQDRERFEKVVDTTVRALLSATIPAVLAASSMAANAPAAAVVVLSGAGGLAVDFIQNTRNKGNISLNDLEFQGVDLIRLNKDDIDIHLRIDDKKKEELRSDAKRRIDALCVEIAEYEKKVKDVHDIAVDKAFGEWVQNFLIYADAHPDDRKLQLLRDELINRLASMRIRVYDELRLNDEGKPDVPIQDYLIDSRKSDDYERVTRPAVYSNRAILARGEVV